MTKTVSKDLKAIKKMCSDVSPEMIRQALRAQGNSVLKARSLLIASGESAVDLDTWDMPRPARELLNAAHLYRDAVYDSIGKDKARSELLDASTTHIENAKARKQIQNWLLGIKHKLEGDEALRELRSLSQISVSVCQTALAEAGGDVRGGLRWILRQRHAIVVSMNAAATTDEEWALWELKCRLRHPTLYGSFTPTMLDDMQAQLDGLKPLDKKFLELGRKARAKALREQTFIDIDGLKVKNWQAKAMLPEWAGFRTGRGEPSTGEVTIEIAELPTGTPAKEQIAAWKCIKSHGERIRNALAKAVFAKLDDFRKTWNTDDFPKIQKMTDLAFHMRLGTITILDWAKNGVAYTAFTLRCTWDEEHGLGVFVHKNRIITVGQAEAATGDPKRDGGKQIKS